MESTTFLQSSSLITLAKALRPSPFPPPLSTSIFSLLHFRRRISFASPTPLFTRKLVATAIGVPTSSSIRGFCGPIRCASSGGGGGDGGGIGGGGGGGGGGDGSDGGAPKGAAAIAAIDDVSALSDDAIVLDVSGMTCGGCASKVKRILESQPQVSSASVNLAAKTAIVWPVSEAKAVPNWREELGKLLAIHLTNCGFVVNVRGQEDKEEDTL